MLIIFQFEDGGERDDYPFKFNVVWLKDPGFTDLVRNHWMDLIQLEEESTMDVLVRKLKSLKSCVVHWK